ncbi:MAG: hypothetical protein ACOYM9_14620 [Bradymonadia bacterium]
MSGLTAGIEVEWVDFTDAHAATARRAHAVAFGYSAPFAGAIVGVYGSGKSALQFALMREAKARGFFAIWEEAAALFSAVLPEAAPALPQDFVGSVRDWAKAIQHGGDARAAYVAALARRGHEDIAEFVAAQPPGTGIVLLLDEVEQAHKVLHKRIATDDGQPLRALIDGCGKKFRLFLAYAPESYHSVGDADRGRLVYLPVPSLDVRAIQARFEISRPHANFVWWASRGRARGVLQAIASIIEPLGRGEFESNLHALPLALEALPGVFGVPAVVQEGATVAELRQLIDLAPVPSDRRERGIVVNLSDQPALADLLQKLFTQALGTGDGLQPVAFELVGVLNALGDDTNSAHLTASDFRAAVRVAEARAVESGRVTELSDRLADVSPGVFYQLGTTCDLSASLRIPVERLVEHHFPSPFTDPMLPVRSGRTVSEAELARLVADLSSPGEPLLESRERDLLVFADFGSVSAWLSTKAAGARGVRAAVLDARGPRGPVLDLAHEAGRAAVGDIGRFHGTFCKCLAILAKEGGHGRDLDRLVAALRGDRQLQRKLAWHLDRIDLQFRDLAPRPSDRWARAEKCVRETVLRAGQGAAKLDADSPAMLSALLMLRDLAPSDDKLLQRLSRLLAADQPLRQLAADAAGKRLSGAGTVVNDLLPTGGPKGRSSNRQYSGKKELISLLEQHGTDVRARPRLAEWLCPEQAERLAAVCNYFAGDLPDVNDERDRIEALAGIEETVHRATAILEHLSMCIGRPASALTALKLGKFTDRVRAGGSPVEEFRQLSRDIVALPPSWTRSLALWICGVFAEHIVRGVEQEQMAISDWESTASDANAVGQRSQEVERRLRDVGAAASADRVVKHRRELASYLGQRGEFEQEVSRFRRRIDGMEQLAPVLRSAVTACANRSSDISVSVAKYLPDEDGAVADRLTLQRLVELLEQFDGSLPKIGDRGLVEYAGIVTRVAAETRGRRLRSHIEESLQITVMPEVIVTEEDVLALDEAWSRLGETAKTWLRASLATASYTGTDSLLRWVLEAAEKESLLAALTSESFPGLDAMDKALSTWARRREVRPDALAGVLASRSKAVAAIGAVWPGRVRDAVVSAMVAATPHDPERRYTLVGEAAAKFERTVTQLMEQICETTGEFGEEGMLDGGSPELVTSGLEALLTRERAAREVLLQEIRAVGLLLKQVGESAAQLGLNPPKSTVERLLAQERERLRAALLRAHDDVVRRVAAVGAPDELAGTVSDDLPAWLEDINDRKADLPTVEELVEHLTELGVPWDISTAPSWEAATAALRATVATASERRDALVHRFEELARRARRLGLHEPAPPPTRSSIEEAVAAVAELDNGVKGARRERLRALSDAARAIYESAVTGSVTGPLPEGVAELVGAGLLRTLEDEG